MIRRVVEGVVVRHVEDSCEVDVVFEGTLRREVVDSIVDDACNKLGALEGRRYVKERIT